MVQTVKHALASLTQECTVLFDEPLAPYTTFRVGGPADALVFPQTVDQLVAALQMVRSAGLPLCVLGGGANVVVADAGIRGVVVATRELCGLRITGSVLEAGAGCSVSDVAAYAADHALGGLDFIYAMPGSTGGAVWMNARCYDGEIAQVLSEVEYVTTRGEVGTYRARAEDFAYKVSPFQTGDRIIVAARFTLHPDNADHLWATMRAHQADRAAKGHFDAPSAGSVFKNDRRFGEPSGAIIDRLGLRGTRVGGAEVSARHANIIVNTGNATARDIRTLVKLIQQRVAAERGIELEPEILFVGAW